MRAVILFLINFLITLGFSVSDGLFSVIFKDTIGSGIFLSLAFVFYSASKIIFSPFAGRMLDRVGSERILLFSLVLYSLVSALFIFSDNKTIILAARILQGGACAFFRPVLLCLISSDAGYSKLGRRIGQFDISFYLALAAGPLAGGFLLDLSGKTGVFAVIAACCALSLLLFLLFSRCPDTCNAAKQHRVTDESPAANSSLNGLLVYIFFKAWGISAICMYLPLFMHAEGFSASHIGFAVGIPPLIMASFLIFTGRLSDVFRKHNMIFAGGAAASLAYLCLPLASDMASILVVITVSGIAGAVSQPAGSALLLESSPEGRTGRTVCLFNAVMGLGFSVSPLVNGILFKLLGAGNIFVISGLLGLASSIYFILSSGQVAGDAAQCD
ncbi:MFS transporter [Seleniivibrio sp.]|uniref:MFS transporter n=1 Tax=Seleniivibrio sp. TaxID=2898801 RepID=UPI0025ECB206|nr:MFS transporter [Seleniivibrio sp.]MCD8554762.1 MFS transporter [Seleniivibrio sp.]